MIGTSLRYALDSQAAGRPVMTVSTERPARSIGRADGRIRLVVVLSVVVLAAAVTTVVIMLSDGSGPSDSSAPGTHDGVAATPGTIAPARPEQSVAAPFRDQPMGPFTTQTQAEQTQHAHR